MTKGGEFRIGHDARHKSNLINEALSGTNEEAIEELEQRGWTKFLEKRREVVSRPQQPKRETKAKQEFDEEYQAILAWDRIVLMKWAGRALKRRGQYHRGGKNHIEITGSDHAIAILEGKDLLRPITEQDYADVTDREMAALDRHRHMVVDGSPLDAWMQTLRHDVVG